MGKVLWLDNPTDYDRAKSKPRETPEDEFKRLCKNARAAWQRLKERRDWNNWVTVGKALQGGANRPCAKHKQMCHRARSTVSRSMNFYSAAN
jgi:hypothetical protein